MKISGKSLLCAVAVTVAGGGRAAEVVLFQDDLSELKNFSSITHHTARWESDGTNAVFSNEGAPSTTARARLVSNDEFVFKSNGEVFDAVSLEFSATVSSVANPGYRLEIGLISASTVGNYTGSPLTDYGTVKGAVVVISGDRNPPGLLVNPGDGAKPGAGANDIPMSSSLGMHTYKIVFSARESELYIDGVSQGKTKKALELGQKYKIVAWGQGWSSANQKSFDDVKLVGIKN